MIKVINERILIITMRFKLVAVGGTFDIIHKGHIALLDLAFTVSKDVIIGLTSDEFLLKRRKAVINNYDKRVDALSAFLDERYAGRYTITKLEDDFGPTLYDNNIEALIVSKETESKGILLNRLREDKGLKPLEIIVMDMVLAKDGKPISSTRIRSGEIDAEGNVRSF